MGSLALTMPSTLARKFASAGRVLREEGAAAVLRDSYALVGRHASRWADRWLRGLDNPWLGRLIELRGDIVHIEGCDFSVRSPAIGTDVKSRFLFGRYEKPERMALKQFLDPALPVVEFGAAIGVVACLTNRRLRDPERHVVVEANPALLPILTANRDANGCRFTILNRAVAHGGAEVTFHQSDNYLGSSAHAPTGRPIRVTATTLAGVLDEFGYQRCSLVCDIEGGEADVVRHELATLTGRVQTFIVEVHRWAIGDDAVDAMIAALREAGFTEVWSRETTHVFQNSR